jgi:hypothetical protein
MPENNLNSQKDDEIDLLDLFKRMGRSLNQFFNSIGRGFLASIVFVLRNWLPLGLSLLAGVGTSLLLKSVFPPIYRGDFVLRTNAVPSSEMIAYINKLHVYCSEENTPILASSLSLSEETARQIRDIRAFWIIDRNRDGVPDYVDYHNSHSAYDTINIKMSDRLNIRIKASSALDLGLVRSGILKFINSDSLFRQRNNIRIRQNQELLTRLTYDIKQLDSLQKVKYFEETRNNVPKTGGQIVFLQDQKTQLVYTDIYDLYTRKQLIETQQLIYKDIVTLISDLTVPLKPITRTLYYGVVVIPLFFILTLIILILIRNRSTLKEVYNRF